MEDLKRIADLAFVGKDYEKAIEFYTKGIEKSEGEEKKESCFLLYSNKSLCYYNLSKWEESLEDANKSISLNPKWSKVLLPKKKKTLFLFSFCFK